MEAIENIWRLAASSTRIDGEIHAEATRTDDLRRRGRDFAAQLGRRIEDLSREESRLRREIDAATVEIDRLRREYERAGAELTQARAVISSVDKGRDEMTDELRRAYEAAGAAAARRQARAEAVAKVEAKIGKWREDCERIDLQLVEYREQLDRHASVIEDDLQASRQRLIEKAQERDGYRAALEEAAAFLFDHFQGRPGCNSLFEELDDLERSSIVADPPMRS